MDTYIPSLSVNSDVFERKKIKVLKHFAILHRTSREESTERNRTICLDIWQEERSDQREQQVQRLSGRAVPGML